MLSVIISGGELQQRLDHAFKQRSNQSFILDGQTDAISIDAVRNFQKSLSLSGDSACHFILEVQNISLPGQQALLKILEEPQTNLQIILTVDRHLALLPTILSRCQLVKLQTQASLDEATNISLRQLLNQIATANYGQLIALAPSINQNQPEITLKQLLILLQQSLFSKPNLKRAQAIRATQMCLNDLQANLNPLLTIEHYLVVMRQLML